MRDAMSLSNRLSTKRRADESDTKDAPNLSKSVFGRENVGNVGGSAVAGKAGMEGAQAVAVAAALKKRRMYLEGIDGSPIPSSTLSLSSSSSSLRASVEETSTPKSVKAGSKRKQVALYDERSQQQQRQRYGDIGDNVAAATAAEEEDLELEEAMRREVRVSGREGVFVFIFLFILCRRNSSFSPPTTK